ncbi:MAG: CBU_0592 family membrane protein [Bacteroidota bacterium]
MKLLVDILGWIGSVEVILAYGLNSFQKINSDSLSFQLLNLTGAVFLIVNTIYYGAYPSTMINIVWVLIAIPAIIRIFRKQKK